tara:strand:+ start:376 stop:834 length:459 start_codon:yes stop_codon:yes gene_type:complete
MKLEDKAPNFSLKDKNGKFHSLKDIKSKYIVIYFYPRDSTPGCTVEANEFNKYLNQFKNLNTTIIGISGGDEKSKTKFCDTHNLKFTLLSDTEYKVSNKYGVYGEKSFMGKKFMGISRITFILDKNKKIIKIYDKVKPLIHSNEVLEFIKSL